MHAGQEGAAIVGVDIGTTSVKVAAFDTDLATGAVDEVAYPLHTPAPQRAEQDPQRMFEAVVGALHAVAGRVAADGRSVAAVGMGSAMHGLMALDRSGQPLTPLVTFADGRAARQAERMRHDPTAAGLHQRTGTPLHPMSPLTKLVWFREQAPEIWREAAIWLSIKEYVLLRLFGRRVIDHSVASATGLFNLATLDWDEQALRLAALSPEQLPDLVPTTHVLEGLDVNVARRLGLDPRTPFVVGAGDGVLANLGVGALSPDVAVCSVGTSGAVRMTLPVPHSDPRGQLFCYALSDRQWVVGGAINNGGLVLQWLLDEMFSDVARQARASGGDPHDALISLAGQCPPGAEGLIMLPYLTGERAPAWRAVPGGLLYGLRCDHGRAHVVRAALEGVMLQLHSVMRVLEDACGPATEIRATGGFAASPVWLQIMADVFARPVTLPESSPGSALGACLLARYALGWDPSLDVAGERVRMGRVLQPDSKRVRMYRKLQDAFEELSRSLADGFAPTDDRRACNRHT